MNAVWPRRHHPSQRRATHNTSCRLSDMKHLVLAVFLAVTLSSAVAEAGGPGGPGGKARHWRAQGTWAWQAWQDCAVDRQRFCGNVPAGGGRIMRCLSDNRDRLSPDCGRHVVTVDTARAAWGKCQPDIERFCRGILPGGGRIVACLAGNRDRLSDQCRQGLREAENALRY